MSNNKKNILHISSTPLVGAPGKINKYINMDGEFSSSHFILQDYPKRLAYIFLNNSILFDINCKELVYLYDKKIEEADIIHIHNGIDEYSIMSIDRLNRKSKKIFHVHSPLREGPLYSEVIEKYPFKFDAKVVVCHIHPRLYREYIPVPNLIDAYPSYNFNPDCIPKLLFTPSHNQIKYNRFGNKFSENIIPTLEKLDKAQKIEWITPQAVISPNALISFRRYCQISIDEIVTGGFHQVSLESLCCGNVTINNSDFFSRKLFELIFCSREEIPFIIANDDNLCEVIENIVTQKDKIKDIQYKSYSFYKKYLLPEKLVKKFIDIYHGVLLG